MNLGICYRCKYFSILRFGYIDLMYFCSKYQYPKFVRPLTDSDKCEMFKSKEEEL